MACKADVTGERDGRVAWGPTAILNTEDQVVAQLSLGEPALLLFDIPCGEWRRNKSTNCRPHQVNSVVDRALEVGKLNFDENFSNLFHGHLMLIIFGGLPGSGKTTIARALAQRLNAVHVRVDTIEQAIRASGVADDVGPAGYIVAYGIAGDNLAVGRTVVADSVNPLPITRAAWLAVAQAAGVTAMEVEVVCSDKVEHRRRVETRVTDVEGLVKPTWQEVSQRAYEGWHGAAVVDTASKTVEVAVDELVVRLNGAWKSKD